MKTIKNITTLKYYNPCLVRLHAKITIRVKLTTLLFFLDVINEYIEVNYVNINLVMYSFDLYVYKPKHFYKPRQNSINLQKQVSD